MTARNTHGRLRQRTRSISIALLLATATASACSRSLSVQTPPTPVYAVMIENRTGLEIIVSYDDGSGLRALGTVLSARSERFIIAASAAAEVEISATSRDGARRFGPYPVTLRVGTNVPVIIR